MARDRGDALGGTASPATGFLLVENNGPWSRRAFEDFALDPDAGRAIAERARAADVRPLFIRRPGRRRRRRENARFAFADAVAGRTAWGEVAGPADLVGAEWSAAEGTSEPLYLVCTHGRHDRCCAISGRPMAMALAALRPRQTWECSHVGGDRFAANVVVLPWGLYYGFTDPSDAEAIVAATERGEVLPRLLRGRSSDPPVVQAARVAAQQALDERGIDGLRLQARSLEQRGRWHLSFSAASGATASVTVQQVRLRDGLPTCAHDAPVPMRELQPMSVTVTTNYPPNSHPG